MLRRIVKIDEEKCNGCGLCVGACHEGAIGMVDGKARLLRDDYCDGLGDCLPVCPTGAISFEERDAVGFSPPQCPGSAAQSLQHPAGGCPDSSAHTIARTPAPATDAPAAAMAASQLAQWPVQIKLAPVNAPYFDGARLLIAADCTAYAYAGFHERFMKNHITLIGCPKLDAGDYAEKLTEILRQNDIKQVTVVRMEVPCCGGIENAVKTALAQSGKLVPWQVVTIATGGAILDD